MTTFRSFSSALLVLVLVCCAFPAWARSRGGSFQGHLDLALSLYKSGEYEQSIKEFQAAYALRQMPRLLLNLGQAHRKLGHAREALGYYEFYLRVEPTPRPEIKTELEGYIAQARAMLHAAERAKSELNPTGDEPAAPVTPEPTPAAAPVAAAPVTPTPVAAAPVAAAPVTPASVTPAPAPRLALAPVGAPAPARAARPIYKKPLFWVALTAGAVVVGGAVAAGVVLGTRGPGVPAGIETHGVSF